MKNKLSDFFTFFEKERILITGHTGFKGIWLTQFLKKLNAKNIVGFSLDPKLEKNRDFWNLYEKDTLIKTYYGDIRDDETLKKVFFDFSPTIVFHLAAQPLVLEAYKNPQNTYAVNFLGTLNVGELIRLSNSVKVFINITTDKVYSNKEWEYGYREIDELGGFEPYSTSKACADLLIQNYFNTFYFNQNKSFANLRAGNVIGGGDFSENRLIPDCYKSIKDKKKLYLRNPDSTRPYQHVLEPIFFYIWLSKKLSENKEFSGCYNIGPIEQDFLTNEELVKMFLSNWKDSSSYDKENKNSNYYKPHEQKRLKLDISLIKDKFGWKQTLSLDETIDLTVAWYKAFLEQKILTKEIVDQQIDYFLSKLGW